MQKPHKELLRALVNTLRLTLAGAATSGNGHGDLSGELERLGFAPDGTITALDALPNPSVDDLRAYRVAEAQLGRLPLAERIEARAELIERAAYSWINRLLALRALEARGLIGETLRANPDYEGIPEALFILRATEPARTSGADGGWWAVIEDACRAQAQILPGLFDLDDPNAVLRPSVNALRACVKLLGAPRLDEVLADPDEIGWAYQFYQEEAKARVYAKLGSGGKVETRREIAAATQLFTEPYMVAWLLQNSLGRSYAEAYPATRLTATWEYYIDPSKVNPEQPAAETTTRPRFTLDELTVLDPCMGSGHFLRAAFDLLFAMYQEQRPDWTARTITNRILERHLYGIDIDPRAAQLAALTLVLRAWERVQQAESGFQVPMQVPLRSGPVAYTPPRLNLATTPKLPAGALDRHLERYADDAIYRPVLARLFGALEQAPLLGSLLRPEEHLDAAIDALMTPNKRWQPALLSDDTAQQAALTGIQGEERSSLKARLLERLGASFVKEAADADVSAQLLGREASEGVHLVQLLSRKYAVVATNPPYMGSKSMSASTRNFVEKQYMPAKRDLFAALILRALELTRPNGFVAMVTMNKWLYLSSYEHLRKGIGKFRGLLTTVEFEAIADLGSHAFAADNQLHVGVQVCMFNIRVAAPKQFHAIPVFRLISLPAPEQKDVALKNIVAGDMQELLYIRRQHDFTTMSQGRFAYWLTPSLLDLFNSFPPINSDAYVRQGICTTNDIEFVRYCWEIDPNLWNSRWFLFAKGGGVTRWAGFEQSAVEWAHDGVRVKTHQEEKPGAIHWSGRMPDSKYLFRPGWTFTRVSGGNLAVRELPENALFGHTSPTAIPFKPHLSPLLGYWLNTRLYTFLLRTLTQSLSTQEGYVQRLPLPNSILPDVAAKLIRLPQIAQNYFRLQYLTNYFFDFAGYTFIQGEGGANLCVYYAIAEGYRERLSFTSLGLEDSEADIVTNETGIPAAWFPLIAGKDELPKFPAIPGLPPLSQEVVAYLEQHKRINLEGRVLERYKANLTSLYEAGPGSKTDEIVIDEHENSEDEDEGVYVSHIPYPTDNFLEELSINLQIHPISVYWLLEELRSEGVRCLPEERRLLEDRLTVIVLRLLGHRWPKQIETGESVPEWADRDGVIPLTPGAGEATLAERARSRLRAEEGDLVAQQTEALLQELSGRDLAEWLRRDFFTRHQRQFKKRPIAWHLRSTPQGRGKRSNAIPAFECLVYYHATDTDILARIRTRYVEPLILAERSRQSQARQATLPGVASNSRETIEAEASQRISELEEFANRLRQVEEQGFACADLERLIAMEPLDRWSGDGYAAPASTADLLAHEAAWRVDINDGVRVNLAPLQAAGLLAGDVLAKKELPKAVADRARWRADERRWVRAGKLPRCGWMDERVPESPAWTEQAPQREAERQRLEEKRKKVLAELQG